MASQDTVAGHVEVLGDPLEQYASAKLELDPSSASGPAYGETVGTQAQYASVAKTLDTRYDRKTQIRGRVGGAVYVGGHGNPAGEGMAYMEDMGPTMIRAGPRRDFYYPVATEDMDTIPAEEIKSMRQSADLYQLLTRRCSNPSMASVALPLRWPFPDKKVNHAHQVSLELDFVVPAMCMSELLVGDRQAFEPICIPVDATALTTKMRGIRTMCERHGYDFAPQKIEVVNKQNQGMPCAAYWQLHSQGNHGVPVHWMKANRVHCCGATGLGNYVNEEDLACRCEPNERTSNCCVVKYLGDEHQMTQPTWMRWAPLDEDAIMRQLNGEHNVPGRPDLNRFFIPNPHAHSAPDPITYLVMKNLHRMIARAVKSGINLTMQKAIKQNADGSVTIFMPKV